MSGSPVQLGHLCPICTGQRVVYGINTIADEWTCKYNATFYTHSGSELNALPIPTPSAVKPQYDTSKIVVGWRCPTCQKHDPHTLQTITSIDWAGAQWRCAGPAGAHVRMISTHDFSGLPVGLAPRNTAVVGGGAGGQGGVAVASSSNYGGGPSRVYVGHDPGFDEQIDKRRIGYAREYLGTFNAGPPKRVIPEYPHTCTRCKKPAYVGLNEISHKDASLDAVCKS